MLARKLLMRSIGPQYIGYSSATSVTDTLTITLPGGVLSGDLLLAVMNCHDTTDNAGHTWTGDTGWTEIIDQNALPNIRSAWKVAGGSEPNPAFTVAAVTTPYSCGSLFAFRSAAYDAVSAIGISSSTATLDYDAVTLAGGYAVAVAASGQDSSTPTFGTPSGFTAQTLIDRSWAFQQAYYKQVAPGSLSGLSSTVAGVGGFARNGCVVIGVKAG